VFKSAKVHLERQFSFPWASFHHLTFNSVQSLSEIHSSPSLSDSQHTLDICPELFSSWQALACIACIEGHLGFLLFDKTSMSR
jgi:hypothetical protein